MKHYEVILYTAIFLLFFQFATAQKYEYEKAEVYFLKGDFSVTKDVKQATYLLQIIKSDDTTYTCRYYNKFGPMLKQETFFDSNLSMPNGIFSWYDLKGNIDSFTQVYKGRKTSYIFYDDNLKPIVSAKYKNGNLFEKRDYLLNIYTDSTGNTSDLKEKEERDKLPDSITATRKAASFSVNAHNEWKKYLEKHLQVPDRFEKVMPNGSYEVVASFLITKEGKVSEVFLMRSCEWSADLEVFKVFKDSPLWQPATQNGNSVIYRQRQSFTFSVN